MARMIVHVYLVEMFGALKVIFVISKLLCILNNKFRNSNVEIFWWVLLYAKGINNFHYFR